MGSEHLENLEGSAAFDKRLMSTVVRMPFEVIEGRDGMLYADRDGDGYAFLDCWNDEGVCCFGYNSPEFRDAIQRFLASGAPHQLPDVYPHAARWKAAEALADRTGMDRVFFANSGTEANEAAIKLARKHRSDQGQPERHVILTIEGNFHGRTGLSLAASDPRVSPHHREGFGPIAQGFGVLTWTGCEFLQVVTDGREHDPKPPLWNLVAAIMLAPVLGNNVVHTYTHQFWETLRETATERALLVIHDDVQAGCGRAGHFATWQGVFSWRPDILTLGKGLALGFPMSAMLAKDDIARAFTPGAHFNTFGGSPFVCSMATYLMGWLDDNLEGIRERGGLIRIAFERRPWIVDYDGAGLLNAFRPDYERFGYDGYQFCEKARAFGLGLITHRERGPIRFIPRLNAPWSEIESALELLDATHRALVDSQ